MYTSASRNWARSQNTQLCSVMTARGYCGPARAGHAPDRGAFRSDGGRLSRLGHQPELRHQLHLVEVQLRLRNGVVLDPDQLNAAPREPTMRRLDLAGGRGHDAVVGPFEGEPLGDPVVIHELAVEDDPGVRERVEPGHRVCGDRVPAFDPYISWSLEHAVLGVQRADALLVVRVESVHELRGNLACVGHEGLLSVAVLSPPARAAAAGSERAYDRAAS